MANAPIPIHLARFNWMQMMLKVWNLPMERSWDQY